MPHAVTEKFGRRNFGISMSTLNFFLLTLATGNFFFFKWILEMTKAINEKNKIELIKPILPILMIAFGGWSILLQYFSYNCIILSLNNISYSQLKAYMNFASFGSALGLASGVVAVIISFKARKPIEQMLQEQGLYVKLSSFLCFILPGIYQYYCIVNAEERFSKLKNEVGSQFESKQVDDKFTRLEQLAKLKDSGVISDEEFLKEKAKILSND